MVAPSSTIYLMTFDYKWLLQACSSSYCRQPNGICYSARLYGFQKSLREEVKMSTIIQQMVHHKWGTFKVKFKSARSLILYIKGHYIWLAMASYLVYAIRFWFWVPGLGKRKPCLNLFTILNKFPWKSLTTDWLRLNGHGLCKALS